MKTLKSTGPLLIRVETEKTPTVPKGKVRVYCVRYETYELDADEFDKTTFRIHDAACEEARTIAEAVNL